MAEHFSRGNEISTLNDNYASDTNLSSKDRTASKADQNIKKKNHSLKENKRGKSKTIATENDLLTIYFGKESSNLCADLQEIFTKINIADINELRLVEIALRAKKQELTKRHTKNNIQEDDGEPKKSYYQKKVREGAFYWNVRYTKNGKTVTEHLPDGLPLENIDPAITIVSFHPDYLKEKGFF